MLATLSLNRTLICLWGQSPHKLITFCVICFFVCLGRVWLKILLPLPLSAGITGMHQSTYL
jgi:hypothetical protein